MQRLAIILVLMVCSTFITAADPVRIDAVFGIEPPPASKKVLRSTVLVVSNPNPTAIYYSMKFYKQSDPETPYKIYSQIPLPAFSSEYHCLFERAGRSFGDLHGFTDAPVADAVPWEIYTDGFKGFKGQVEITGENNANVRAYSYSEGRFEFSSNISNDPRSGQYNIVSVYANYYQVLSWYAIPNSDNRTVCLPWLDCWPPNSSQKSPGWDFKLIVRNYDSNQKTKVKIKFKRLYGDIPSITQWQLLEVIPKASKMSNRWDPGDFRITPSKRTISLKDYLCGSTGDVASGVVLLKFEGGDPYITRHWAISLD